MGTLPYLCQRRGRFYFRRRLPGFSTFFAPVMVSLGTTDRAHAAKLCVQLSALMDRMLDETQHMALPDADVAAFFKAELRRCVQEVRQTRLIERADGSLTEAKLRQNRLEAFVLRGMVEDGLRAEIPHARLTALPEAERDEAQEIQARKFQTFMSPAFNQAIQLRAGVDGQHLSQFDQLQLRWKAVEARMAALDAADTVPLHTAAEAKSAAAMMMQTAMASASPKFCDAPAQDDAVPRATAAAQPHKPQVIAEAPQKPVTPGVDLIQGRMTGTAVLAQMTQAKAQEPEAVFDGTSGTASSLRVFGADIAGTAVRMVKKARGNQETKEQMLKSAVLFIFLTGVQVVSDIQQEHLDQFAHLLEAKWPVHYWKSPKEKDLTSVELIEQAAQAGKPVGLVPTTIERHMNTIAGILEHAKRERNGLDFEPEIRRLIPSDNRTDAEKREVPTQQDMKTLFSHPLWSGCAGNVRGGRHKLGPHIIKDHHFWINLTLAYTGARRSEIAGLLERDVRQDDGIPYISIQPNHLRGLKTKDSKRRIPLHPHLVELGFMDFVKACRKKKHLALFPEAVPRKLRHLAHSPDPTVNVYDEKFGDVLDYMARTCFETSLSGNPRGLSVHGMRHYVNEFLSDLRGQDGHTKLVSKEDRMDLLGHKPLGVNEGTYRRADRPLGPLYEVIKLLPRYF